MTRSSPVRIVSYLARQEPDTLGPGGHEDDRAAGAERRRHERLALACRCWLEADDLTICGPTADIGAGGLFLRTAAPLAIGSRVDVFMEVADPAGTRDALSARARVTRTIPTRSGSRPGVGVEFLEILRGENALSSWLSREGSMTLPWLTLR